MSEDWIDIYDNPPPAGKTVLLLAINDNAEGETLQFPAEWESRSRAFRSVNVFLPVGYKVRFWRRFYWSKDSFSAIRTRTTKCSSDTQKMART